MYTVHIHINTLFLFLFDDEMVFRTHTKYNTNTQGKQFSANVIILKKQFLIVPIKFVCLANTHIQKRARTHTVNMDGLFNLLSAFHRNLQTFMCRLLSWRPAFLYPKNINIIDSLLGNMYSLSKCCRLYVSTETREWNFTIPFFLCYHLRVL